MPSVFPNGIEAVVKKTGWPIVAHNRYWANDTDYATQVSARGTQSYVRTCSVVSSTSVLQGTSSLAAAFTCAVLVCI